jgi:succinyl-diaminopimelate desuccinylase
MFNIRNSTKTTVESVKSFIAKHFETCNYELDINQSSKSFLTNPNTVIVATIDKAIQKVCNIVPKHSTAGGTSDARFFAEFGVETIEFGVINDTIHAPNERTTVDEVQKLYQVFLETIKTYNINEEN